jgi:hypothetical protein
MNLIKEFTEFFFSFCSLLGNYGMNLIVITTSHRKALPHTRVASEPKRSRLTAKSTSEQTCRKAANNANMLTSVLVLRISPTTTSFLIYLECGRSYHNQHTTVADEHYSYYDHCLFKCLKLTFGEQQTGNDEA